jgi:uncharacterized protein YwgA
MDRLWRASLLLAMNEELRKAGSWAGETHMQKATFFLQELVKVPLEFEFLLYKHGPFSFDLRDELTFMRAQGFLRLEPQYPYGPTLVGGEKSELLKRTFQQAIDEYFSRIRFVAEKLGTKSVTGLERTATALYVTLRSSGAADRVRTLTDLKPHIPLQDAQVAVSEVDEIIRELGNVA